MGVTISLVQFLAVAASFLLAEFATGFNPFAASKFVLLWGVLWFGIQVLNLLECIFDGEESLLKWLNLLEGLLAGAMLAGGYVVASVTGESLWTIVVYTFGEGEAATGIFFYQAAFLLFMVIEGVQCWPAIVGGLSGSLGRRAQARAEAQAERDEEGEKEGQGGDFCPGCGAPAGKGRYCSKCGAELSGGQEKNSKKSRKHQ